MNEAENKDANAVEEAVNAGVTDNHASGQEAVQPEQERQKCSSVGYDNASPMPAVEEATEKSEPEEAQASPEADASRHDEPAGDKPAEPSGDLNDDTGPSPISEPAPEPIIDTRLDDVLRKLSAIESKLDTMSLTLDILARQKEDSIHKLFRIWEKHVNL